MKNITFRIIRPFLFILLIYLNSCAIYKEVAETDELTNSALSDNFLIPEHWALIKSDSTCKSNEWYLKFNEPQLNTLVSQALDSLNPGIMYRMARVHQSIAEITLAKSSRQVHANYGGQYGGSFNGSNSFENDASLTLPVSWEADLWGKLKVGVWAANEKLLSEIHQLDYTKQTVVANVARLYFKIGTLKQALSIGNEFMQINRRLIEVHEKREDVGISDSKDVHLAKAKVASLAAIIQEYENQLQVATRSLEVILGRYPSNSFDIKWQPQALHEITSLQDPLSLISRRPDLLALENQVRQAFYLAEQAELAQYPSLVLGASPGIDPSGLVFGFGASILGPIFNGKEIKAKIKVADAKQKQILALYGSAIQDAFKEVETNLSSEQLLKKQVEYGRQVAEESKKAYNISVEQYIVGQQDLYYTLLLQGQYLLAELSVVDIEAEMYFQRIQLYLSLGGDINQKTN